MNADVTYAAALTAGSILTGFVGIFLNFRIEREANYFRSPGSCVRNQQHFTTSLFLIIIAALSSVVFGVLLPLLALVEPSKAVRPATIAAGIVASIVLIGAYFIDELVHYEILWHPDKEKGKDEMWIVVLGLTMALGAFTCAFCLLR